MDIADDTLDFWLRSTPPEKHFAVDPALDAEIARRFGALHAALASDISADWRATPRNTLAAIIVLDQFSRNLGRGTADAFANDPAALALTRMALDRGDDAGTTTLERQFTYMPLMHSENMADQDRSLALFTAADQQHLKYAREHRATIARFGRFPQRNAALGRPSTPDEIAFLEG